MNDIHCASENFKFILYADDTTLVSPLCSFTLSSNRNDINQVSSLIIFELSKISDWLAIEKLSSNAEKIKYLIFHNYQKVIAENDIPHLTLNGSVMEKVTQFDFLGLTTNENMIWKSPSSKIANKISRTLGVMNRLKDTYLWLQWNRCMTLWYCSIYNLGYHVGDLIGMGFQTSKTCHANYDKQKIQCSHRTNIQGTENVEDKRYI